MVDGLKQVRKGYLDLHAGSMASMGPGAADWVSCEMRCKSPTACKAGKIEGSPRCSSSFDYICGHHGLVSCLIPVVCEYCRGLRLAVGGGATAKSMCKVQHPSHDWLYQLSKVA